MKGYIADIEKLTLENTDFRRVLYTGKYSQLVLMCIPAGEDIGREVHPLDQFLRCEAGEGVAIIDEHEHPIQSGSVVLVPAGAQHNIRNTSNEPLKLYSLYSPPNHRDGVVHKTKADAQIDEEHFDGSTSEPL